MSEAGVSEADVGWRGLSGWAPDRTGASLTVTASFDGRSEIELCGAAAAVDLERSGALVDDSIESLVGVSIGELTGVAIEPPVGVSIKGLVGVTKGAPIGVSIAALVGVSIEALVGGSTGAPLGVSVGTSFAVAVLLLPLVPAVTPGRLLPSGAAAPSAAGFPLVTEASLPGWPGTCTAKDVCAEPCGRSAAGLTEGGSSSSLPGNSVAKGDGGRVLPGADVTTGESGPIPPGACVTRGAPGEAATVLLEDAVLLGTMMLLGAVVLLGATVLPPFEALSYETAFGALPFVATPFEVLTSGTASG